MRERFWQWLYDLSARRLGLTERPAAAFPPQAPVLPAGRARGPRLPRRRTHYAEVTPEEWLPWN